jgi:hypothetical protein
METHRDIALSLFSDTGEDYDNAQDNQAGMPVGVS